MSPALNNSSALERFECRNAIEIRNGIMFDFYPGLPHMLYLSLLSQAVSSQDADLHIRLVKLYSRSGAYSAEN